MKVLSMEAGPAGLMVVAGLMLAQSGLTGVIEDRGMIEQVERSGARTVGPSDEGCDHTNLQNAIQLSSEGDEIRIHTDYEANVPAFGYTILSRSVTLRGGLQDCSGSPTFSGRSVLDADGQGRVMWITASGEEQVTLRDLVLTGGETDLESGGGGLRIEGVPGLLAVALENVLVSFNTAERQDTSDPRVRGGGIHVETTGDSEGFTPMLTVDNASRITNNQADSGGGLACTATDNLPEDRTIIRLGSATIDNNHAHMYGGGIMVNGCRNIFIYSGEGTTGLGGIAWNNADYIGGGIFSGLSGTPQSGWISVRASQFQEFGNSNGAGEIVGNHADQLGGGIQVSHGSKVQLFDTVVHLNSARAVGGGGINTGPAGSRVEMMGTGNEPCDTFDAGDLTPCSRLRSNTVDSGWGDGLRTRGGELDVRRTYISGHEGNNTVYVEGTTSTTFESVLFHDNEGGHLILGSRNGDIDVRWSTIVHEESGSEPVIRLESSNGPLNFSLTGSIMWAPGTQLVSIEDASEQTATAQCVIGHQPEAGSGFTAASYYSQIDPEFVDPDAGDFRISDISPAIDYCNPDSEDQPSGRDLDGRLRGELTESNPIRPPNGQPGGVYDLGAFIVDMPLLFRDRFEED
ncbi:hypothetical protein IC757_12225 [Wenzhouxiangella sp. AB-CW3]|uniref:hypothetical protein n=1 Tax=Wenzhouxiangella sp. AB-CW3 TaxID=2771012 RepID=UPI00168AB720|nr:hypothetical protein [Wenzhouxiangella sp. AB-CW3]QOC21796.1 hypothetical protein IC757_12225 [Wenzhouxiangella sp. AB-CW3]